MSAEQLLTILAIIVLSVVLMTVAGLVAAGFMIRRKLRQVGRLRFISIGSFPALLQIIKFLMRRKTFR